MLSMAPSVCSNVNVGSCSGGMGVNCDRSFRPMAQSWTSLMQPHVRCKCINLVRRLRAGRSCREESAGRKKKLHWLAVRLYSHEVLGYIGPRYSPSLHRGGRMKKVIMLGAVGVF